MKTGYTIIELIISIIGLFLILGWFINVYKVIYMIPSEITNEFILRVVGIFVAPFGGIIGWL